MAKLVSSVHQGGYVDTAKSTLSEYLDRWEADWAAVNVGPKTLEELLRVHVRPVLGVIPVQKLQTAHLAELYARLLREGGRRSGEAVPLSPRTVGHVHRVLHKALTVAMEWGIVSRNVASVATPPKISNDGGEIEILNEDQARLILQHLRGRRSTWSRCSGCRPGCAAASFWRYAGATSISMVPACALSNRSNRPRQDFDSRPPKTKHGRRTIALAPSVVAELRQHRKKQLEERLRLGMGKIPDDSLVLARWDGKPRSPNAITEEWSRALAEFGMPAIRLHALRHTHASQLIASGLDVLTISRRLGHGSPTITLGVYAHKFSNEDEQAAQVMENAYGNVRATD